MPIALPGAAGAISARSTIDEALIHAGVAGLGALDTPLAVRAAAFILDGGRPDVLGDMTPVLPAEAHGDYHAVAAAGAFNAQWKEKSPW